MIDDNAPLIVRKTFERPEGDLVARYRGAPTSFVADAMGGRAAMDWRIKPLAGTPAAFAGVALPCHAGPGDNLAVSAATALAQRGDVILAATDAFAGAAVLGDLLLGMMRNRGVAAFVTDGLVRDLADIQAIAMPCFAMGITPDSPSRSGPGTVGLPVVIGGVAVAAGDIVVGDADGVVVVPRAQAAAIADALDRVRATEAAAAAHVKAGQDVSGNLAAVLEKPGIRFVD
jgi:regulator of RNase E activity RraA